MKKRSSKFKSKSKKKASRRQTKAVRRPKAAKKTKTARKVARKVKSVKRAVKTARKPAVRAIIKPEARIMQRPSQAVSVSGQPNLIVTYEPTKKFSALEEIRTLLKEIGESADIVETNIDGIVKVRVGNPREAVRKLSSLCGKNPEKFCRTYHWSPVDKWCSSKMEDMRKVISDLQDKIGNTEKWKMHLEKRQTDMHERELITKLTEVINKPNVDLKNPDKIIKVDILGNEAAIAVLSKDEFLNTTLMK